MLQFALGLTLAIAGASLVVEFATVKGEEANAQALSVPIIDLASDFDFYVHTNRVALAAELQAAGASTLTLSATRQQNFFDQSGAGSWRAPIANLAPAQNGAMRSIAGLDLRLAVTKGAETAVFGVMAVSRGGDFEEQSFAVLRRALVAAGATAYRSQLPEIDPAAQLLLGRAAGIDDIAFMTALYSGVRSDLVLREARAGHAPLRAMATDLSLQAQSNGPRQNISGAGTVRSLTATITEAGCFGSSATCASVGPFAVTGNGAAVSAGLSVTGDLIASSQSSFGSGTVRGALAAQRFEVTGASTLSGPVTTKGGVATTGSFGNITSGSLGFAAAGASAASVAATFGSVQSGTFVGRDLVGTGTAEIGAGATRVSPAPVQAGQIVTPIAQFRDITTHTKCIGC